LGRGSHGQGSLPTYSHFSPKSTEVFLHAGAGGSSELRSRLHKQASDNEILVQQIKGEIESEQLKRNRIELQSQNVRSSARTQGEAEADRVHAFFEGLGDLVARQDAVSLFHLLRKQDILEHLSKGTASLYFTPADVNLSIETPSSPAANGSHGS